MKRGDEWRMAARIEEGVLPPSDVLGCGAVPQSRTVSAGQILPTLRRGLGDRLRECIRGAARRGACLGVRIYLSPGTFGQRLLPRGAEPGHQKLTVRGGVQEAMTRETVCPASASGGGVPWTGPVKGVPGMAAIQPPDLVRSGSRT